jgi:hypothetical protein
MSLDSGNENEGHSTLEPDDENGPEEIEGEFSAFPVIHLGPDGVELGEDGEPVKREEEEYHFYRLERLAKQLDHAVTLRPEILWSVNVQAPALKREKFQSRFENFLQKVKQHIPAPTPEILDDLFQQAIQAQKRIMAWEDIVKAIKSDEFSISHKCLRAEVARFEAIRKLLRYDRKTPSWMSSWERLWIEAFEELGEDIEAQLRGAKKYLETFSAFAKLGRTEVESQVLRLSAGAIRKVIAKTPLSKVPSVVLAAFAYAAQLVPWKDHPSDAEGRYVDAIKARITRAKRSKAGRHIPLIILLYTDGLRSAEKDIPPHGK